MRLATQDCPTPEVLESFLLGTLEPPLQSHCESHVSDCSSCHDTLRGLDAEDTLSGYVSEAFEQEESVDDRVSSPEVRRLIDRLTQPENLELGEKQLTDRTMAPTRPKMPRAELELMADRAAEVLRCLSPEDSAMGKLGHYELIRLIGAGSSGVVFQANDTSLNRLVAVKVLRPSLGPIARQRFLAEAKAAAAIEQANVVTIFHVGEQDRLAYMVMQWLPGQTLDAVIQTEPVLSEARVRNIATEVAKGLAAAHQKQMIHRDIKPANIWLAEDGSIKLLDFGLARIADDDSGLTATGMLAGTPNYMSPEQSKGLELDGRSDLFSLGCLMYRLLTGRLPFGGSTVLATLQSIQHHYPIPVQAVRVEASDELTDITMALLEKQPANRPDSAQQVISLLQEERQDWPMAINRYEGVTESSDNVMSQSPEPKPTKVKTVGNGRSWIGGLAWVAGLLMLAAAGFWMGPQIIRIATDQGELIIETNDEAIEIEVLQNGKLIKLVDVETKSSLNIQSGEYQLKARSKGDVVTLNVNPNVLTMTRGGKQLVKVTESENASIGLRTNTGTATELDNQLKSLLQSVLNELKQGKRNTAGAELQKAISEVTQQKYAIKQELELNQQRYGNGHSKIQQLTQALQQIGEREDQLLERYQLLTSNSSDNQLIHDWQKQNQADGNNPLHDGQAGQPTYNGFGFEHWLNIAKNDRHPKTFSDALSACAELAETESHYDDLLQILQKTTSEYALLAIGSNSETDALVSGCLKVAHRLPKTLVADFVLNAYRNEDNNQKAFATWLAPETLGSVQEFSAMQSTSSQDFAEAYIGRFTQFLDLALKAKQEPDALKLLSFALPLSTYTPTDELTKLNPTLRIDLLARQDEIKNHSSSTLVAHLLPLMTRLNLDVAPIVQRLDATLQKDKKCKSLNANRKLFIGLGHVQTIPWPGESDHRPSKVELRLAKSRLKIMLRELEKFSGTQDSNGSVTSLPGDLWVRPLLNSIYQNAAWGDLLINDPDLRKQTLEQLRSIRKQRFFSPKDSIGEMGYNSTPAAESAKLTQIKPLLDSMIEAVEQEDLSIFRSNKTDSFGYRPSGTSHQNGFGGQYGSGSGFGGGGGIF